MRQQFFLFVSLMAVLPSLCTSTSVENRLESLEQIVSVLQTKLLDKDNRISQLENQLSEVTERVNILELLVDKDEKESGLEYANDEIDLETKDREMETYSEENLRKIQKTDIDLSKSVKAKQRKRHTLSSFASKRQSISTSPKIAFHAYQSGRHTYGTHEIIIFNVEEIDIGHGYNNVDGIYVVPVTGVYAFAWTIVSPNHSYHEAELMINGKEGGSAFADSEEITDTHQATGVIVAHVSQGDNVFVRLGYNGGGYVQSDHNLGRTTFTGWLLFDM